MSEHPNLSVYQQVTSQQGAKIEHTMATWKFFFLYPGNLRGISCTALVGTSEFQTAIRLYRSPQLRSFRARLKDKIRRWKRTGTVLTCRRPNRPKRCWPCCTKSPTGSDVFSCSLFHCDSRKITEFRKCCHLWSLVSGNSFWWYLISLSS